MPVMDGIECTKRILSLLNSLDVKDEAISNTRIVALTSFTNDTMTQRCLDAGMKEAY